MKLSDWFFSQRYLRVWLLLAFFLSGACALIYQVVWVRMLGLIFGNTTYAVSTVLCAFMAGLALGSYYFGRYIDYKGKPLLVYSFLEAGIGLYCLFIPLLFAALQWGYIGFYRIFEPSQLVVNLVRFIAAFVVMVVPATLMGGTLPVLSKFFVQRKEELGWGIGVLYSVNTWGAVLGTFAAGFFLILALGVKGTLYTAAIVNLGIAAFVFYLSRNAAEEFSAAVPMGGTKPVLKDRPPSAVTSGRDNRGVGIVILVAVGVSGFAALVYEVVWTRVLSMILGSSVYAFATMLCSFLCGIALGSILFARFGKNMKQFFGKGLALLGFIQGGIGVLVLLLIPVFGVLPFVFLKLFSIMPETFIGFEIIQFLLAFGMMLIPTTLFGMVLPLAVETYNKAKAAGCMENIGRTIGSVYAANTIGAVFGSVLAGFALVPLLGLQSTIMVVALINIGLAIALLSLGLKERRWVQGVVISFLIFFTIPYVLAIPSWNKKIMTSGAFYYTSDFMRESESRSKKQKDMDIWTTRMKRKEMLYYREGTQFTIAVERHPGRVLGLSIDGKTDASNDFGSDMISQILCGHLPLLVHSGGEQSPVSAEGVDKRSVLVIGLASGVTLGAVTLYPVRNIDCVEIEPGMVEASGFFDEFNHKPLEDKRVNLIINDGRSHLLSTEKRYDVIISVPSNPWVSGSAPLFTKEFYELAKSRLKPDGIFLGWLQVYLSTPKDYKVVLNTFRSVFPHASVWQASPSDTLLLATPEKLSMDYSRIEKIMASPKIMADLRRINLANPLDVLTMFMMGEEKIRRLTMDSIENTDNYPVIEFQSARNIYGGEDSSAQTQQMLMENLETVSSYLKNFSKSIELAKVYLNKGLYAPSEEELRNAINTSPGDPGIRNLLGLVYLEKKDYSRAQIELEKALDLNPNYLDTHMSLGRLYLEKKDYAKAISFYRKVLSINGKYAPGLNKLGEIYMAKRDYNLALKYFGKARSSDPGFIKAYVNEAIIYIDYKSVPPQAILILTKAFKINPRSAQVCYHSGRAFLQMNMFNQAAGMFNRAISLNPDYEKIVRKILPTEKVKG